MPDETPTPNPGPPEQDASAELAAGFLVGGGRFSLLHELGRGGMGLVWLAHDERLMASVALKFLSEKVRGNPSALNDLRQETKKSRMLSHPNIIRIYDLYEAPDELPFISMEYVDGPSLWVLCSRQATAFFPWDFLKPIVRQLCEALEYAHGERVIHRDLKPANMLLDDRQRLRLADFGMAAMSFEPSAAEAGRRSTTGTPAYISPQQFEGKAPSATDDIYALGTTLYELLTGKTPFYQNDIPYQVRHVQATSLQERLAELEVDNEVPPAVAATIMACLSKEPAKRPQSARAVAEQMGLIGSPAMPTTAFVPRVLPAPITETKETALAPPTVGKPGPPLSINRNEPRRRLAMVTAPVGLGLLAWLAWGHFLPKMPDLPLPISAVKTNDASSTGTEPTNAAAAAISVIPLAQTPVEISVSIELGSVNRESGLREVAGQGFGATTPATIGGKECRRFDSRKNARCYFQIATAFKRPAAVSARIQVEYWAASPGGMQLRYDGSSPQAAHYANGGKTIFDADSVWKIANYKISDALFRNGELGGADFCLTATCDELYIHSVTVSFDQ